MDGPGLGRVEPGYGKVVGKPTAFFISEVRTLPEESGKLAILFCFLTEIEAMSRLIGRFD